MARPLPLCPSRAAALLLAEREAGKGTPVLHVSGAAVDGRPAEPLHGSGLLGCPTASPEVPQPRAAWMNTVNPQRSVRGSEKHCSASAGWVVCHTGDQHRHTEQNPRGRKERTSSVTLEDNLGPERKIVLLGINLKRLVLQLFSVHPRLWK